MHRELTKRVIVEKTVAESEKDYLKKLEQFDGSEIVSDVELVSHQVVYSPQTFIAKKIILIGFSLNEELFSDSFLFLKPEKKKVFLEEVQDDLSVKIWDKLSLMTTSDSYKRINNPQSTENIIDEFFLFTKPNELLPKYNFVKKTIIDENIQTTLGMLVSYKLNFVVGSLHLEDKNSLHCCFTGILHELYFSFYQYCKDNNYTISLYSISTIKLYSDRYESFHSFMIRFCFSDSDGKLIRYNSADF